MCILVNGHNLYVEAHRPECGPAVVLLHHGLGSVRAWKEQVAELDHADNRMIAYDRWGYGASDARPALDLPTFTADMDDLRQVLTGQGVQRVSLVGHSDGGTIALYFAAQFPELVDAVITIAAHIYVEPKMEGGILGVKQAFETDERFRQGLKRTHGDKFESTFRNWFDGWHRKELLSWDMRPVLATIHCPVLVVQGEEDEHATPQHAKDIAAAIPGAELWLVPGAGHMLPQEHAGEFNEKMLLFLGKHG